MSLEIDINDINRDVAEHQYEEVTSSNLYLPNSSQPDPAGLASFEIFGAPGTPQRSTVFGYISLNDYFVHPDIFRKLSHMNAVFKEVAYGDTFAYIDENGELTRISGNETAPEGAPFGTGVKFLYDYFEKIVFVDTGSSVRRQKLNLLELMKKDEIFITKFLVIPAFYRDVDNRTKKANEVNDLYRRVIMLSRIIRTNKQMFTGHGVTDAHRRIIDTLAELYNYFMGFGGTKGFMRKHVLGKATDFAARVVISSPDMDTETPETMEVSFDRSAIPLSIASKCFAPFMVHGIKSIVDSLIAGSKFIYVKQEKGDPIRKELADHFMEAYSSDAIYRMINRYSESKAYRVEPFTIEMKDGTFGNLCYIYGKGTNLKTSSSGRTDTFQQKIEDGEFFKPMNMTELFYMAAMHTIAEKACYITRYPIEDYNNMYPSKMNIIPCRRTKAVTIDSIDYPRFPDFSNMQDDDYDHMFADSLRLFPTYLAALGGDYDGDMCSIQAPFSEEGQEEAIARIYSPVNFVNIGGGTMRKTSDVTAHMIFNLTYSNEVS